MVSAAFTIEGSPTTSAIEVAAGATVDLALVSTTGVRTVAWSIVGGSDSTKTAPTITPAGSPSGATAQLTMNTPVGSVGCAWKVQCKINNGRDDAGRVVAAYTATGIVGVVNAASPAKVPLVYGEELEREPTYGITDTINAMLASVAGTDATALRGITLEAATVGAPDANDVILYDGTKYVAAPLTLDVVLAGGNLTNGEDIILDDSSAPGVPVMTLGAVTGTGSITVDGELEVTADEIDLTATTEADIDAPIVSIPQGVLHILGDETTVLTGETGGAAGLLRVEQLGGGLAGFNFYDDTDNVGLIAASDATGVVVQANNGYDLTLQAQVADSVVVAVGDPVATFEAALATFAEGVDVAITTSGGYAATGNLRTGGDFEFVGLDSTAADMPLLTWYGPGEAPNTLTLCYGSVPAGTDIYLFDQTSNGTVNIWGAALDVQSATVGVDIAGDIDINAGDDLNATADGSTYVAGADLYLATNSDNANIYMADGDFVYYGAPSGFGHLFHVNNVAAMRVTTTTWGVMAAAGSPASAQNYTVSNPSATRTIDVSASDLATTRAVVGTIITDLIAFGLMT